MAEKWHWHWDDGDINIREGSGIWRDGIELTPDRVNRLETALHQIAFDDDTSYFACSDWPNCQGIGPHGHAEDCAVGIARAALASIEEAPR